MHAYNKTTPTNLYFLLNFTKGTRWIRETIWCGLAVMADLRCSSCSLYLFNSPVQCSCGDRLCGDCFNSLKSRWVQVTSRKSAVDVVINNMQNWTIKVNFGAAVYTCQLLVCSKKVNFNCPKCAEEISLDECFKDKAAENELKTATIKCTNQGCPWEGSGKFFMVSIAC